MLHVSDSPAPLYVRGKTLGLALIKSLSNTSLSSAAEINALMELPVRDRDALVARAVGGEKVSACERRDELLERFFQSRAWRQDAGEVLKPLGAELNAFFGN